MTKQNLMADLKMYGAILKKDATECFGDEIVKEVTRERIIKCMSTSMGDILYLSYKGRISVGFTGGYNPKMQALMNTAFMRKVEEIVISRHDVYITRNRKKSLSYTLNGKHILVLARQNGYTNIVVRRIYCESILTNRFQEMHIFYYNLDFGAISRLRDIFFAPSENKRVLDKRIVKLYSVDPEDYSFKTFNGQKRTLPVP